ncbi:MAG TPA: hypothetical protein DDX71_05290 [Ruminococcus sp.]|nr:hypothetical protein [Ruminococcus sp.]
MERNISAEASALPQEGWLAGALTPQERSERSQENRESGEAARAAQENGRPRELSAAEQRMLALERIAAEREERRAQSERNRLAAQGAMPDLYDDAAAEQSRAVMDMDTGEIDIDVPTDEPETESAQKQPDDEKPEKKQSKKQKSAKKHTKVRMKRKTAAASAETVTVQQSGRYREEPRQNSQYQGRITVSSAISIGLMAGALIGVVIYGRVQTNEIYSEIAEKQAVYDDLVAKNVSMRSEMEGKMTVKNIQEYAENVLGLRQLHQSQIEYIQLQTEDEVVISEPEENFFVTINDYIKSFWELLRGK